MKKIISGSNNKYDTKNPLLRYVLNGFFSSISTLLTPRKEEISSICEFGCGEGELTLHLCELFPSTQIKAFDISADIVAVARQRCSETSAEFYTKNINDVNTADAADCIVCCEVLEHIEKPEEALEKVSKLPAKVFLFSVPNEPIWRILNFFRGKYILDFGNSPGHIHHWTPDQFRRLIEKDFDIIEENSPFPWTMVLTKPKNRSPE